jgi:hypothetical protein
VRTIYKYPLNNVGLNAVHMPTGAKILSCQLQREIPTLWAMVDDTEPLRRRRSTVVGTGHALHESVDARGFLATLQLEDGIVLHVFEVEP